MNRVRRAGAPSRDLESATKEKKGEGREDEKKGEECSSLSRRERERVYRINTRDALWKGRGGLLRQRKRGQGRMREGRVTTREIRRKAHSGRRKPLLISRQICLISQGDGVGVTDSEIRVRATFSSRMLSHTARLWTLLLMFCALLTLYSVMWPYFRCYHNAVRIFIVSRLAALIFLSQRRAIQCIVKTISTDISLKIFRETNA